MLQGAAFKTEALTATKGALNGAAPGAIRIVVQAVFSVNPDTVPKGADANGEPVFATVGKTQARE